LGGIPKALLRKDGSSFLKRFIRSTEGLDPIETLVVTGFYSEEVEAEITSLAQVTQRPLDWIRNPNPEAGQASSVRLGIESLKSEYDVVLIALCDQPNIAKQEIESLLEQFKQRSLEQEIILPMIHGQRGNPVLFSRAAIEKILAIPGMVCRSYMDAHPELVKTFVTDNQAYLQDVDTQDDIQTLGIDRI
jgi:molybdenum cofactor cytidylyltransferase/nicotine blue oxidoreductase